MAMTMTTAKAAFLMVGAFAILLPLTAAGPVSSALRGTGQEWLSWSPAERRAFIDGYVTGYVRGTRKACDAANDLFEVGIWHRLGDDPAARCMARLQSYSRDSSAYTAVITDFYTKHSEYRDIPFFYLMWFLSDSQNKTADELYQMALKGEIRSNF